MSKSAQVCVVLLGLTLGGSIGFLLRPSVLGEQLPFEHVITRGTRLDQPAAGLLAVPLARKSFNFLIAGAIAGACLGGALVLLSRQIEMGRVRDRMPSSGADELTSAEKHELDKWWNEG